MPSSPTSVLRLELQANGENSGNWGNKVNNNYALLEQAITAFTTVSVSGGQTILTATDYTIDTARSAALLLVGIATADVTVVVPNATKPYFIRQLVNQGSFNVYIKTSTGDNRLLPPGNTQAFSDGSSIHVVGRMVIRGASTLPGLYFDGDEDTGVWSRTNNNVGLVAGGINTFEARVSNLYCNIPVLVTVGTSSVPSFGAIDNTDLGINFTTSTIEHIVNAGTRLLVNTSSIMFLGANNNRLQVAEVSVSPWGHRIILSDYTSTLTMNPDLALCFQHAVSVPSMAHNGYGFCLTYGGIYAPLSAGVANSSWRKLV